MKTPYFVLNCFFQLIVNETELGKSWRTHSFNGKNIKDRGVLVEAYNIGTNNWEDFYKTIRWIVLSLILTFNPTLGSLTHSLIKIEKLKLKLLRILAWNADSSKHFSSQRTLSGKDIESTSCIKIHWAYFYKQINLFPTALSSIDLA